ncbi:MAG: KH domain-containing protein [Anaerolineales bacterium]|nr:KH domain-containing protein [Anaerolineales bacterium]
MEELIEYIAESLVDDPSAVDVRVRRRGKDVRLELTVADADMGRVIGRGGRVANAMRSLLRVAASQEGVRATLDII